AYLESSGLLAQTGSVVVMSNTGVLHNISLADLAEKLRRERGSAALGASGSRWCETCALAGIYKAHGDSRDFEVVPRSLEDEKAAVDVTILQAGQVQDTLCLIFDVE
ncbi:unnamed protein product, partial [Polarella glacialis]